LKFLRDRKRWVAWLYEAKKRLGLAVLNYTVTSNHIHLLVQDTGEGEILKSMQLIAGKVAQQYNLRKERRGAFWKDRYHATAVDSGEHLFKCLVYIDMNMVRAGVTNHPNVWATCGYHEIQNPRSRYGIIDHNRLAKSLAFESVSDFQTEHRRWVDGALINSRLAREPKWSHSIAVGSEAFVHQIADSVNPELSKCKTTIVGESFVVREPPAAYSAHLDLVMGTLSPLNAIKWNLSQGQITG